MTGDSVERGIVVPAAPAEVWAALTEPEHLRAWFGAEIVLEPRAGGAVRARWPDGSRSVGAVEEASPPRRLVFRWRHVRGAGFGAPIGAATRIAFSLEPTAVGTSVSVIEELVELAAAGEGAP